jgi:hypothetical protein
MKKKEKEKALCHLFFYFIWATSKRQHQRGNMKKVTIILLLLAVCASAYCEAITRQKVTWVQGHQEATYCGSGGCLTFMGGYSMPFTLRWDFYKGKRCY